MTPRELEPAIRTLLKQPLADAELREQLEKLAAAEISFSGFTWLWGPELYRRNRVLFRPFVLSHFSTTMLLPKWRVKQVSWKDYAAGLNAWFADADRNDDADLFRRLYDWKLSYEFPGVRGNKRSEEIRRELLSRFRGAPTAAKRQVALRKFELWFEMDEETALGLYSIDPRSAGPYILRHLPGGWFTENKRVLWQRLITLAEQKKDDDFRWKLYRRQVRLVDWTQECFGLCSSIKDPAELVKELEKRHPEGGLNLAETFFQLAQKRGRDVFPYLLRHLQQVWRGWLGRGSYGKMADYAREQGWWDLWSALVRTCSGSKEYNKEVRALLENCSMPEPEIVDRLRALAGASREWNFGGFGAAAVHQLEEPVALLFYERFPDLLRGPFKLQVQLHVWGSTLPKLLERFLIAGDEEMIDYFASRLVTRQSSWGSSAGKMVEEAERLAEYYGAMKLDEALFSRRAANVLSKVPAFSVWNYNVLIRQNRLARLLFERSAASHLADPRSIADLVEGAEIHVMSLGYRTLGLNDDRARAQASTHLPLLLGTLLRPLQRQTRTLAFGALANAANDLESARLILERAKDALHLPDVRYPKEKLLGLIAQVLHRWPELREAREQPVVYERAA